MNNYHHVLVDAKTEYTKQLEIAVKKKYPSITNFYKQVTFTLLETTSVNTDMFNYFDKVNLMLYGQTMTDGWTPSMRRSRVTNYISTLSTTQKKKVVLALTLDELTENNINNYKSMGEGLGGVGIWVSNANGTPLLKVEGVTNSLFPNKPTPPPTPAPPTPSPTPVPCFDYTVLKGDTCLNIATFFGTSLSRLGGCGNIINTGNKVNVCGCTKHCNCITYSVASGDSCYSISNAPDHGGADIYTNTNTQII